MSNQRQVYRKVGSVLRHKLEQARGHVQTLAMMVTGIVEGKQAQLSKMSTEVPHWAKDKSIERRFRRWVTNERITQEAYFDPFAKAVVQHLSEQTLLVALDSSAVGRGCQVLMAGVIYQKRLLPLTWTVYRGEKGHAPATTHVAVMEALKTLIPEDADVIVVGDGEYDAVELLKWIQEETSWDFVMRTARDTCVRSEGEEVQLQTWGLSRGQVLELTDVLFTRQGFGPVNVVGWWGREYSEPVYLVTSLEVAEEACHWYGRRYRIETLFSDQKSRGFHIDKSHLSHPERLARLLIATCLTYLWMIYLGVDVIQRRCTDRIDRADRRDKSLFRLGLDWLAYLLKHDLHFSVRFCVPLWSRVTSSQLVTESVR